MHACLFTVLLLMAAGAASPRPAPADTLTVVTLNIWHDQRDWPKRLELILGGLRATRPDVVCLQEVLQHESLPNQAGVIADRLGFTWHFTSVDSAHSVRRYGNAILTPHEILERHERALQPLDDYRTAAHVRVRVRGRDVDVYDTHLHHTADGGAIRARQVADLLDFVRTTRGDGALVLAGDFNATPGSPEMQALATGFTDTWAATHAPSGGAVSTLNVALGHAAMRIDHVFVPRETAGSLEPIAARLLYTDPGPDSVWASDHFGVAVQLAIPRTTRKDTHARH